jgi:hypothetical protein
MANRVNSSRISASAGGASTYFVANSLASGYFCALIRFAARSKSYPRMPQLDVRAEQQPIGASISERHSHAAGIHNSDFANPAIELHMCVPANRDLGFYACKGWQNSSLRRQSGENLIFVARRPVAEQNFAKALDLQAYRLRPSTQHPLVFRADLLCTPAHRFLRLLRHAPWIFTSTRLQQRDLAIPVDKLRGLLQLLDASKVSTGMGPGNASPPTTIRSTFSCRTSSNTASSAGRFAWMS